ncbi:DUF5685 family protein [Nocardiopsis lambiniae]|uniref:DUF5685 family protein n=1 Tax=Nocardiopsis lambiniae TaxID=3075539 RepID=A0ABU2MD00_9ACTN|nr:DUF5685 family protein [Nocardiopsis sp. DSM 44743]MDT0329990.1 DUF5685 family protein [Nocardiopsis sp. DSM 44743]
MFGILRPCRHTLPDGLAEEWMSHMCGLCLALRDDHGQASRIATNYDGLVVSVLTAAQAPEQAGTRRAGRCPLRGMRGARVADGAGAHLAAAVSLMLASAKITDHIEDGDGLYARRGVRALAGRVAERWRRGATASGDGLGLDGSALLAVIDRQRDIELSAGPGTDVLTVTAPTEEATGEAFAHTAVLAGRPANAAPLREAGRLFGRVAHLLDAVEDLEEDRARGAWNPLTVTGTDLDRARDLCDGAVLGVRLALAEAVFTEDRLVRALLVRELGRAVERTFSRAGHHPHGHPGRYGHPPGHGHPGHHGADHPHGRRDRHRDGGTGHAGGPGPGHPGGGDSGGHDKGGGSCRCSCQTPDLRHPPRRRGPIIGCAVALFMCCTCQFCCRDPHPGPWTGEPRSSWCDICECCDCPGCEHCCCCCDG